ncbi:MAG: DUF3750 domain-containing protein [Marinobacter sp.]|nr:DUF3750 domain-containing protein [Marinobacter sp.]
MKHSARWLLRALTVMLCLLTGPLLMAACGSVQTGQHWYEADRSSAGIAPLPDATREAVVQVYAARAFSWRGFFAVHTWIASKRTDADHYTVYDVTGWGESTVRTRADLPDRAWYGNSPRLLADIRGTKAARLIPQIQAAVRRYPYPDYYRAWPGPNSNTFVAWVIREVPELQVALPNTAIGKDFLPGGLVASTPSGSGYQVSLGGYAGVLASVHEGLEVNLLGLSFGLNPQALGIKLPGLGEFSALDPWMESGRDMTNPSAVTD